MMNMHTFPMPLPKGGGGMPNAYPLAVVPGLSVHELEKLGAYHKVDISREQEGIDANNAILANPNESPCAVCAFNKNVPWRNPHIAANAIDRALSLDFRHRLVCHHGAELKDGEYVGNEHSDACYGAFHLTKAIKGGYQHPMVFSSIAEMMEYHRK